MGDGFLICTWQQLQQIAACRRNTQVRVDQYAQTADGWDLFAGRIVVGDVLGNLSRYDRAG